MTRYWCLGTIHFSLQLRRETDLHSHYAYYEVLQTNYKYLSLPDNRCADKDTYLAGSSITECVEGFIENQLNCSIPWHNFRAEKDECKLEDQFVRYAEVSEQLAKMDEQQIWELTGCMRPCDQIEYRGAIHLPCILFLLLECLGGPDNKFVYLTSKTRILHALANKNSANSTPGCQRYHLDRKPSTLQIGSGWDFSTWQVHIKQI